MNSAIVNLLLGLVQFAEAFSAAFAWSLVSRQKHDKISFATKIFLREFWFE
jgi:hypothetical protein